MCEKHTFYLLPSFQLLIAKSFTSRSFYVSFCLQLLKCCQTLYPLSWFLLSDVTHTLYIMWCMNIKQKTTLLSHYSKCEWKKSWKDFFCLGKHIKCHANWLSKRLIKELELSHYLWNLIYNGNANGNNNMFSVNSKCFVGLFLHAIELREIVEKLSEIQKVPP